MTLLAVVPASGRTAGARGGGGAFALMLPHATRVMQTRKNGGVRLRRASAPTLQFASRVTFCVPQTVCVFFLIILIRKMAELLYF